MRNEKGCSSSPVALAGLFRAGVECLVMKCDGCGQQFPGSEARHDTRGEFGANGRQAYRTVLVTLCPACTASRRNTPWFVLWVVLFLFVALVVTTSVLALLNS